MVSQLGQVFLAMLRQGVSCQLLSGVRDWNGGCLPRSTSFILLLLLLRFLLLLLLLSAQLLLLLLLSNLLLLLLLVLLVLQVIRRSCCVRLLRQLACLDGPAVELVQGAEVLVPKPARLRAVERFVSSEVYNPGYSAAHCSGDTGQRGKAGHALSNVFLCNVK